MGGRVGLEEGVLTVVLLHEDREGRWRAAMALAALDHAEEVAAIDRQLANKEISQSAADRAKAASQSVEHMAITAATEAMYNEEAEKALEALRDRNESNQAISRIQQETLRYQAGLADTLEERLALENQEFAMMQAANKAEFEARQLETMTRLKIAGAKQEELDALEARQREEKAAFDANQAAQAQSQAQSVRSANPFAAIVDQAKDMKFALQDIAANGLKTLEDGLVDVIMRTGSLGDAFKSMSKQVIADLARIAIQKAIVGPLANFLGFGDGAGLFNFFTPTAPDEAREAAE